MQTIRQLSAYHIENGGGPIRMLTMDTTGAIGGEIDTITGGIKLNSFFLPTGLRNAWLAACNSSRASSSGFRLTPRLFVLTRRSVPGGSL